LGIIFFFRVFVRIMNKGQQLFIQVKYFGRPLVTQIHPVGAVFTDTDFGCSDKLFPGKVDIQIQGLVDLVLDIVLQIPDLQTSAGLAIFPDKFKFILF